MLMRFWNPHQFAEACQGKWLRGPTDDHDLNGLSTDTRALVRGQVFCAIRGERFDGHDYCQKAAEDGAGLLLVDRADAADGIDVGAVLLVDDTVHALGRAAAAYRQTLAGCVVAITGSVGKTTTKHLIDSVLSQSMRGTSSPKSFNNEIGVPLTLLSAKPDDQYILCEVGTNAPGEIQTLGKIIEPDIAVITHVGAAHLAGLGTVADVLKEKASLMPCLREDGLAVINADVPGLVALAPTRRITYGTDAKADLRLSDCRTHADGCRFQINGQTWFELGLMGRHNAHNALAAVAIAGHLGLEASAIAQGLRQAKAPNMRLATRQVGGDHGLTLINDAYNANPISMAASLEVLSNRPAPGRRIAILGDMGELGSDTARWHAHVGDTAGRQNIDHLIFIGTASKAGAEAARRAEHPSVQWHEKWSEAVGSKLADFAQPGDTVLIKASRSAALERLIPFLEQQATAWQAPQKKSPPHRRGAL